MDKNREYHDEILNDSDSDTTYVGIGEIALGYPGNFLKISSLGSCIGLVIYPEIKDISTRCAIMGHIMLPKSHVVEKTDKESKIGKIAKYADKAIPAMIEALERQKQDKRRFVAKMAGGAKMFGQISASFDIGRENSNEVKLLLKSMNIPLVNSFIGGNIGMRVIFDVSNYELSVTPTGGKSIIL